MHSPLLCSFSSTGYPAGLVENPSTFVTDCSCCCQELTVHPLLETGPPPLPPPRHPFLPPPPPPPLPSLSCTTGTNQRDSTARVAEIGYNSSVSFYRTLMNTYSFLVHPLTQPGRSVPASWRLRSKANKLEAVGLVCTTTGNP